MKNVLWIFIMAVALAGAQEDTVPDTNKQMNQIIEQVSANTKQVEQMQNKMNEFDKKFQIKMDYIKINKEYLEFKDSILDKGLMLVTILLTIFGLILPIITSYLVTGTYRDKYLKELDGLKNNINELKGFSEKEIDKYAKEAQTIVRSIKERQKEIDSFMKNIDINEKDKKQKEELKEKANEVKNNPNANLYEVALAEAAEYYFSDKYEETLECYEKILEDYKNEITITRLAEVYFQMAYSYSQIALSDKEGEKEDLFNKAIEKFEEVLKLDHKYVKAYYNLGLALMKQADLKNEKKEKEELFDKAIEKFKEALKLDPKYLEAYYNLGAALMKLADLKIEKEEKENLLKQAEDACLKCRDLGGYVYNLACVYALKYELNKNSSDKDESFKYLKKALEEKELPFYYVEINIAFVSIKSDPQYAELKKKYGQ